MLQEKTFFKIYMNHTYMWNRKSIKMKQKESSNSNHSKKNPHIFSHTTTVAYEKEHMFLSNQTVTGNQAYIIHMKIM